MSANLRTALLTLAAIGAIIFVVFLMPPLTQGGNTVLPGVSAAALDRAVAKERTYCEESNQGLDCACFGDKAGMVMASVTPEIPAAIYANRQELARSQAASSC